MNIKHYFFAGILCLGTSNSHCQNLIRNNSFEDSVTGIYWHDILEYCKLHGIGDINICYKDRNSENPSAIAFNSQDGKNCLCIALFETEVHTSDYITNDIPLLKKGIKYNFSFYITPDDSCGYFVNSIDVLFCSYKYLKQNLSCLQPQKIYVEPTLSFDITNFKKIGQEGKWIKLSGSFVANGSENLMVLGNFSNDKKNKYYFKRELDYKTTKQFRIEHFGGAEYFVDNFSLNIAEVVPPDR